MICTPICIHTHTHEQLNKNAKFKVIFTKQSSALCSDVRQHPGRTPATWTNKSSGTHAWQRAHTRSHTRTRTHAELFTNSQRLLPNRSRARTVCAQCPRRQKQAHTLDGGARICPTGSQYKTTTTTNMLPLVRLRHHHPPPLLLAAPPPRPSPSTTPPGQSPPDSRPNRTPCSTWSGTSRPVSSVACPASETSR